MVMCHDTGRKRRRMAPEDRRKAILDAAQALYTAHGWDDVTIADVLQEARISKGGFYHHFSAKEDLLAAVVTRLAHQSLAAAEAARRNASGDALARLNAFLTGSLRWKAENVAELRVFAEVLTKPGNDVLFHRVLDATAEAVIPALEGVIAEGIRDRSFDVPDPRLAAEVIVGLSLGRRQVLDNAMALAASGDLEQATMLFNERMQAEGATCDRLLGLPPGSILLSNPENYRRMLAGLVDHIHSDARVATNGNAINEEA